MRIVGLIAESGNGGGGSNASSFKNKIYAVNSAVTDVNKDADFINKVSETEISFDLTKDIVLTHADGETQTLTSLANISGISGDGIHLIIKEKLSSVAISTLNIATEDKNEPVAPSNGDYWLDLSVQPYITYKRIGGAWVYTEFVKLGQVEILAGAMINVVSYTLNRKSTSIKTQPINSVIQNFNHNIGSNNLKGTVYLQSVSYTDGEYEIGSITEPYVSIGSYIAKAPLVFKNNLTAWTSSVNNWYIPISSTRIVSPIQVNEWLIYAEIETNF